MKKLFIFMILFIPILTFSVVVENWQNVYSLDNLAMGEVGMDIVVDSQGNTYVCGETGTSQYYDYDAFVQKISPEGETLWFHTYGDDEQDNWADVFKKMALDEEHNALYLVGDYCPPSNPAHPKICLVKMNLDGEFLFTQDYALGYGNDVLIGDNGYIYVSGATGSQFFLAKVYPDSGTPVWTVLPEFSGMDGGGTSITMGNDYSIYQGGTLDGKWAVLRYSDSGNLLWYRQYENPNADGDWYPVARYLVYKDEKIYVAGLVNDIQNNDIHIHCYDEYGNDLWTYTYDGGYGFDVCNGMCLDSENNVIVAGYSDISEDASNVVVLKFSSEGTLLWNFEQNVNGMKEGANDIAIDQNDDIYLCGFREVPGYQYPDDYLTEKLSKENGEVLWEFTLDRDNTTDEAMALTVKSADDVFVTGKSHTWNTWYDILTVNYKDDGTFANNSDIPLENILLYNYPNPFKDRTTIAVKAQNKTNTEYKIEIYNLKGEKIKDFKSNENNKNFVWNGKDNYNKKLAAGVYFLKYTDSKNQVVKKITVIK